MRRAEVLARRFHELYEELAPHFDYATRTDSAVEWQDVPLRNKNLMISVCRHILFERGLDDGKTDETEDCT
jgi:hypothetical protein